MSVLKQDQNAYDAYNVMDTVIMGNQKLYDIGHEMNACMRRRTSPTRTACGLRLRSRIRRAGRLGSGIRRSRLLQGLGIGTELHYEQMASVDPRLKVKILLAQALFGNPDIVMLDERPTT